jgi:thiamine pyrophosphate-dependent acetolactate synthase large subunit-like protein
MKRIDALKVFASHRTDEIVIAGVGVGGRELYAAGHNELNLYNVNMPYPIALGLGLALAIPERRTIVLDGDGSFLSGCSTLSVIGNVRPKNLIIVVWDNESFLTTYAVPTPTAGNTNIEAVARGMGIANVAIVRDLASFEEELKRMLTVREVALLVAKVEKTIASDLPIYPFGLTENGVTFRRALINQGLVDPLHAGASWSKVHPVRL